jgi:hypothetical protein
VTTDHAATTAVDAAPVERRLRSFVVDLGMVGRMQPWTCGDRMGDWTHSHPVKAARSVGTAIATARAAHPGSYVLGIREA